VPPDGRREHLRAVEPLHRPGAPHGGAHQLQVHGFGGRVELVVAGRLEGDDRRPGYPQPPGAPRRGGQGPAPAPAAHPRPGPGDDPRRPEQHEDDDHQPQPGHPDAVVRERHDRHPEQDAEDDGDRAPAQPPERPRLVGVEGGPGLRVVGGGLHASMLAGASVAATT
jgi:hypothetical protein